jgi:hypothetical protein
LIRLRHLQLRVFTFDASGILGFSFISYRLYSTTCATVHTHRIPYHCCVPICLRHVHLRFVFSAVRLPWISSANNAAGCALVSPSISSAACTRLRYLWSPLLLQIRFVAHHCFSAPSTFFRNQAVRTLSLGLRPLWLRALAFDVFGVVSLLFSIRMPRSSSAFTFAFYRIF